MSEIRRFEDLIAWQKAREATKRIYEVTRCGTLARDFNLSSQMQRAAVSIMSNIAEGFERSRLGEFHQYLSIAKASCAELRSPLYAALDAGDIDEGVFKELFERAQEVARLLGGLRAAVEREKRKTA
jgi:four helix bundle protein